MYQKEYKESEDRVEATMLYNIESANMKGHKRKGN